MAAGLFVSSLKHPRFKHHRSPVVSDMGSHPILSTAEASGQTGTEFRDLDQASWGLFQECQRSPEHIGKHLPMKSLENNLNCALLAVLASYGFVDISLNE